MDEKTKRTPSEWMVFFLAIIAANAALIYDQQIGAIPNL